VTKSTDNMCHTLAEAALEYVEDNINVLLDTVHQDNWFEKTIYQVTMSAADAISRAISRLLIKKICI